MKYISLMNNFNSLRLKMPELHVLERIEDIIWSKVKLELQTEYQSSNSPKIGYV